MYFNGRFISNAYNFNTNILGNKLNKIFKTLSSDV